MLRLRRRAAALAGATALLLLPAAAHAATPAINVAGAPEPGPVQTALQTGAKQLRFFVSWADLEPGGAGTYDAGSALQGVYDRAIVQMNAQGAQPIFVVLRTPRWANGSADQLVPPKDPTDYGKFLGAFAQHNERVGKVAAYEVWNEPDETGFWHGGVNADAYTAMLKSAYANTRDNKTTAAILTGATTGNDYGWIEGLYARGAKGSFDGVAVHTDTSCLTAAPSEFYRDNESKRLGQFTFLAYREVRASMLAQGDDKPIWMTELGWSSTNGGPSSCQRGASSGQKPSGVSKEDQAKFLTQAYSCMANDPYLISAGWFTLSDTPTGTDIDEVHHYGLLDTNGAQKPAYTAFKAVTASNGGAAMACGDFDGPKIDVVAPTEGQQFLDKLDVRASATTTGAALGRITFTYDGGKQISSVTKDLMDGKVVGLSPWQGSGSLAVGKHTIEFLAVDMNGNQSTATVNVEKVAPGALASSLKTTFKLGKLTSKKGIYTLKGRLTPVKGQPVPTKSVKVQWQIKNKKKKWVGLGGGLKSAGKSFTFKYQPKQKGSWRVRVTYAGVAPYKAVSSKFTYFKVR